MQIRRTQGDRIGKQQRSFKQPYRPSTQHKPMMAAMGSIKAKQGFTLVELMIAIMIIGILMAIAVPAVFRTITTGKQTAIRMEISALEQAVERYMQEYGDYPPDGSSQEIVLRHMRRRYPRMAEPDNSLLIQLTSVRGTTTPSAVAMDRAEALVFFLGGFSKNPLHPLTGEGGPLAYVSGNADAIGSYQYNATRDNSLFDFDPARLTYSRANDTAPLLSTDESVWTGTQFNEAGGADPLPVYLSGSSDAGPIVYFDSRTYVVTPSVGTTPGVYNGFLHPTFGGIRPYKTGRDIKPPSGSSYGSERAAFDAIAFHNPKTFQIISPGLDGQFGKAVSTNTNPSLPVHYITETGTPVYPNQNATNIADLSAISVLDTGYGVKFQEPSSDINGHLDNITNFSSSTLGDDLK